MKNTIDFLNELKNKEFIKDFILVGGTALSLQLKHRNMDNSDLDFVYFHNDKTKRYNLDKIKIDNMLNEFKKEGKEIITIPYSEDEYLEFAEAGEDISEVQQNYIIDDVKISFFVSPDLTNDNILDKCKLIIDKNLRIADINTLARQKINLLSERNKINDYFDIYYLLKNNYINKSIILDELKMSSSMSSFLYRINRIDKLNDDKNIKALKSLNISAKKIKDYFKKIMSGYIINKVNENNLEYSISR